MMPQRVLHIADFAAPYPGSFIRQLRMLNEEIVAGGALPMAFAFPEHARGRDYHDTLTAAGCEIYFLPEPASRFERSVSVAVRDVIERSRATVVHTHFGTYDLSVTHAVRKLRASSQPELVLVWHYRTALEERLDERTAMRRLKDYLKYARAGRQVDACCAVTEALAVEVAARGMGARTRAVVAGCDIDTFHADDVSRRRVRDDLGMAADQVLILHMGWHWHRKGGDLLAAAMLVLKARGYTNLVAASVDAPADQVEYPVRLIEATSDIHGLHAAADIFVSASRSEGFGNGLVEAMACERVAAAALVDGQREVFDGLDGCVAVTPGDAVSLADALASLLDARECWSTWGAANRAHVVEHHSMRRWARDMANVYRKLGVPLTPATAVAPAATKRPPASPSSSSEVEVA